MSVSLCDIDGKGKRLSACLQAGKGFFSTGVSLCHVRLAFKVEKPSPPSTKSVAAGQQLLTSTEQNFFSALEIYFKAFEIVLFPALRNLPVCLAEFAGLPCRNCRLDADGFVL